jgi:type I restriction enzyme, R subunit
LSQFAFLQREWPGLFDAASKAEEVVHADPRTSCFYARRTLELAVKWLFTHDPEFKSPYDTSLSALLHAPSFQAHAGQMVFTKAKLITKLGNHAVHSHRQVQQIDGLNAVRELFHVLFWLARTYSKIHPPPDTLQFDQALLPKTSPVPPQTQNQLQQLQEQLAGKDAQLNEVIAGKQALDAELQQLRKEIAGIKAQNAATPDKHNYSEAQTRDLFIDLLLREAGWKLDRDRDREYPVTGMPTEKGEGFVDYVLWGDDDKPLGLVEAKRTRYSAEKGQQQAKLYANCLEMQYGQRPVIFYSNGYEHWIWDDEFYPPRRVQGFYKKDELQLLIQRRSSRKALAEMYIDGSIVERFYQTRAIRRINEAFETDHLRKALVVMATGAGKTRTVIALCDQLMRANWVKRVLFLADRRALVKQAQNAFIANASWIPTVNLLESNYTSEEARNARAVISTYPTMMNLIDEAKEGERWFGVGHFDLVIIDEAHRSVFQKYRAIFEYFDSLLVGLTATPKDEVDRNTYSLFDLETGIPTDVYGLEEAVKDHYLVPPFPISVPLKFQREGIRYDELSEEEKDQWDALEWDEEGNVPQQVDPEAVNRWLFNKDTVDKVLEHLMTRGLKVADGDRLGKTVIFAKNHDHAVFIADRFNVNYPHYKGEFARVIDVQVDYAQTLIDTFSHPEKSPHIAISVDMLDTGIDIPEIVNLVFFKLVRSKTKYWQMIGRGTRLRPGLFGPGKDKEAFYLFDYCGNLEYFGQNPPTTEGSVVESLGKKLFLSRVELVDELDKALKLGVAETQAKEVQEVRGETAERLRQEVAAMNVENFVVRPHRRAVESYSKPEAWAALDPGKQRELAEEVAGLPSELTDEDQDAKKFDLLVYRLQLALLRHERMFSRLRDDVREIADLLSEQSAIPMVQQQMPLIQDLLSDEYWQDITVPMLEIVRKRLRSLVKLIEKVRRQRVYTDFEDTMGAEVEIQLPGFGAADYERFRVKTRQFLKEHENEGPIQKLRFNEPLTTDDLEQLEQMLIAAGVGTQEEINRAKAESQGLGLFVRSLVGLDREAAKKALGHFLEGKSLNATQIDFLSTVIDHLSQRGWIDPALLYESPFTDFSPLGVEGVFPSADTGKLIAALDDVRSRAIA